jgi:hypothetical protein
MARRRLPIKQFPEVPSATAFISPKTSTYPSTQVINPTHSLDHLVAQQLVVFAPQLD